MVEHDYTLASLSRRLGIPLSTLHAALKGRGLAMFAPRLAQIFGVPLSEISIEMSRAYLAERGITTAPTDFSEEQLCQP